MGNETASATDGTSALMILTPETEVLEIAGKQVTVGPLKVAQLGRFSRAIQNILPGIMLSLKEGGELDLMRMVATSSDELIEAVAIGCNESVEWIGDLDTAEFMQLAGKIMVVNVDFFARRLPQMANNVLQSLVKVAPEMVATATAGTTPSKD